MVCFTRPVRMIALVLFVLYPIAHAAASFTPDCVTGTKEVYMPSPENGMCFCGALIIDPTGGYAKGYCSPYPLDEGLSFKGCRRGDNDDFSGKCQFYCECEDKLIKGELGQDGQLINKDAGKITCCRPTDRFGLRDKTVIGKPPRTDQTTSTFTTMTYRMLTTRTTTTEPYYGPQKLLGNIEFSTVIPFQVQPDTFLADAGVTGGVADGIALRLGVPSAWVTAMLSIPTRYIQADYQITVPGQTMGNLSAWGLFVAILQSSDEDGINEWSEAISTAVSKSTDRYYSVAVHSVHSPTTIRLNRGSANGALRADGGGLLLLATLYVLRAVLLSVLWPS